MSKSIEERLIVIAKEYSEKPLNSWPTVAELARSLRCKQIEIRNAAEESERLDLIVGLRSGNGSFEFADSDCLVEYIPEEV